MVRVGPGHSRSHRAGGPPKAEGATTGSTSLDRFRHLDSYRVEREWNRYEGTPQRDLFRELRERFLRRHARRAGRALEIGPGPGRFSPFVGATPKSRVLLDLSEEALHHVVEHWPRRTDEPLPALLRGDARWPPLARRTFVVVVALGNSVGFAGTDSQLILSSTLELLTEGGILVLETVAGSGERSNYLSRLPPSAVGRLLTAPIGPIRTRIDREGFRDLPGRERHESRFQRLAESEILGEFEKHGVRLVESMAVAPLLGGDPARVREAARHPRAWEHLLQLEEEYGRQPGRRETAASLLISGVQGAIVGPPKAHG